MQWRWRDAAAGVAVVITVVAAGHSVGSVVAEVVEAMYLGVEAGATSKACGF